MARGQKSEGRIADIGACRDGLLQIVQEMHPMTVRQLFYQAVVRKLFHKTELGYGRVQADATVMRKNGELPYEWIIDTTRFRRQPFTFSNPSEAVDYIARNYRKSLWDDIDAYVEVWLEKNALAEIVEEVTDQYDVSLMIARGYSSISFLFGAAEHLKHLHTDKQIYIYHLGDFDPSGMDAGNKINDAFQKFSINPDIVHFTRLALLPEQVEHFELTKLPVNMGDSRAPKFVERYGNEICELDAFTPDQLRGLVRGAIERHMPPRRFKKLKAAERREQDAILEMVQDIAEQ